MSEHSLMYFTHCVFALLLIFGLAACSPAAPEEEAKVVLVTTARPPEDPASVIVGTVRAAQAHDIPAQNGGRIERLLVDVGAEVRAGQLLAVLENRAETLRLAEEEADATRLAAVAWERRSNFQRMERLMQAAAISQSAYDSAKADAVSSAEAARQAREAASLARRDLDLTQVRAPVNGIVASRPVKLSDQVAAGTLLFEIDGQGAREIVTSVPDAIARKLALGDALAYRGAAAGRAVVTTIAERVAGSGSRDVRLKIVSGAASPGSVVEVVFSSGAAGPASAIVPLSAIVHLSGTPATVFVVGKDHRLRVATVTVASVGAAGALVDGPVAPGAQVVTAGGAFLRDGLLVRPLFTPR